MEIFNSKPIYSISKSIHLFIRIRDHGFILLSYILCPSFCILYPISCYLYPVLCILQSVSCNLYPVNNIWVVCPESCDFCSCIMYHIWIMHRVKCILFLHHISCILLSLPFFMTCLVLCINVSFSLYYKSCILFSKYCSSQSRITIS